MSDDVLTPGPQSGASAGQRCLGQVAWRLALVEELRTAWVEAQDLIEALSAASAPDVDSELNPMLRHWIALAERQLRQLAYVGDRLDERVSTSKTGAALFWKVEALNVDHPPGPARDAALFQVLRNHLRRQCLKWQRMATLARNAGLLEVADLLRPASRGSGG